MQKQMKMDSETDNKEEPVSESDNWKLVSDKALTGYYCHEKDEYESSHLNSDVTTFEGLRKTCLDKAQPQNRAQSPCQ